MELSEFFGRLVCQAREEKGLSQLELADELDMDIRTIMKVEDGKSDLPFNLLSKFIVFLHISPNIFFHGEPYEDAIEMDQIYRKVQKFSEEQIKMIFENALSFKKWTSQHGAYESLDEYFEIIKRIDHSEESTDTKK